VPRRYLFSDESGDFYFSRSPHASRYFAVGTLLVDEVELGRLRQAMAALRDSLAWANHGLDSYFHATDDSDPIRKAVFTVLSNFDFRVDVTLLEKAKAMPRCRTDEATFFKYAWFYHLKYAAPRCFGVDDEAMIIAAELGTRKKRRAFRAAIEDVMTQCIPYRVKRTLAFWPCSSDFALQAADYCLWAVTRKLERGDDRYYNVIKGKIGSEFDLWSTGSTVYY
jgi:hypothetical protein